MQLNLEVISYENYGLVYSTHILKILNGQPLVEIDVPLVDFRDLHSIQINRSYYRTYLP